MGNNGMADEIERVAMRLTAGFDGSENVHKAGSSAKRLVQVVAVCESVQGVPWLSQS